MKESLLKKNKTFFLSQKDIFFIFLLSTFCTWLFYRPSLTYNIIQGDLNPYFLNPKLFISEAMSTIIDTGFGGIKNIINPGSAFIGFIFYLLSFTGYFSQYIFYFFAVYLSLFLLVKLNKNNIYLGYFYSIFIVVIFYYSVFSRYLLNPTLFHIPFFLPLVLLLLNEDLFLKKKLYDFILLIIISLIVSANLSFLFLSFLLGILNLFFSYSKTFLFQKIFVISIILLISTIPLILNKKDFSHTDVQERVRLEMVSYKVSGYSFFSSLGLVDDNIYKAKSFDENYYIGFINLLGKENFSIIIFFLVTLFVFIKKDKKVLLVYLLFVALVYSFKFTTLTFNYYINSPLFDLLREYKKIGLAFIVFLSFLFISENKKGLKVLLALILVLFIDFRVYKPINFKQNYVYINYDYRKYQELIPEDKSLLFLPILNTNSTMSQFEKNLNGFYGYNLSKYFHSKYLDTARYQVINNKKEITCSAVEIYEKFDYIFYRKDLTPEYYNCTYEYFNKLVKVYEDDYVIIFKVN